MARFSANFTNNLANPTGLMRGADMIGAGFGKLMEDQKADRKERRLDKEHGALPELDINDPNSLAEYSRIGLLRGDLTPMQALQLGYAQKNLEQENINALNKAAAEKKAADDQSLVGGVFTAESELAKIDAAIARAEEANNRSAVATLQKRREQFSEARDAMRATVTTNPEAAALYDKEMARRTREENARYQAQVRAEATEQARREAAVQSAITPLLAETNAGTLPADDPRIANLQRTNPAAYNRYMEKSAPIRKRLADEAKALEGETALPESYFEGFPAGSYDAYLTALSVSPATANRNAINSRKAMEDAAIKAKAGDKTRTAFTESVRKSIKGSAEAVLVAISQGTGESDEGSSWWPFSKGDEPSGAVKFAKRLAGNSKGAKDRRSKFYDAVVLRLEESGLEATRENIERAVLAEMQYQGVDLGNVELAGGGRMSEEEVAALEAEEAANPEVAEETPAESSWMDTLSADDRADAEALAAEGFSEADIKAALGL